MVAEAAGSISPGHFIRPSSRRVDFNNSEAWGPAHSLVLVFFEFACSRIMGWCAQVQAVKPQSYRSPVLSLFAGIWEAKSRVMPFKATAPDVMPFF